MQRKIPHKVFCTDNNGLATAVNDGLQSRGTGRLGVEKARRVNTDKIFNKRSTITDDGGKAASHCWILNYLRFRPVL